MLGVGKFEPWYPTSAQPTSSIISSTTCGFAAADEADGADPRPAPPLRPPTTGAADDELVSTRPSAAAAEQLKAARILIGEPGRAEPRG